jgi:hypothetical protein
VNRRDLLRAGLTVTAAAALNACASTTTPTPTGSGPLHRDPSWARPLHTVYAGRKGKVLRHDDKRLLDAFELVEGGITALTPFLLNVSRPAAYSAMIKSVQSHGAVIVPGIGGPPERGSIDSPENREMARAYREHTSHVRLENVQGFMDRPDGQAHIEAMIDFLTHDLAFEHVMLNPWPRSQGTATAFENIQLDSSFDSVRLNFDRKPPYAVHPDPENWSVNTTSTERVLDRRRTAQIVVNYESAPQHEALAQLERKQPGSSKAAMKIAADQCERDPARLRWCPPFTRVYDPIELGTWSWISDRLGRMR